MTDEPTPQTPEDAGEPKPKRRSPPWLLGGLVLSLLFVLIALQVFGLWEIFTPDTAADTLLLYALSSLNFVAFIIFTFIFVRNLVKLRRERRARELGSKIKTRLVVYFITVSLLPITAMAVFSYIFFNRSLEKWFSSLPEAVVHQAREVQRVDVERQRERLRETALAASYLLSVPNAGEPALTSPETVVRQLDLSGIALYAPDQTLLSKAEAAQVGARSGELEELLRETAKGDTDKDSTRRSENFEAIYAHLPDRRVVVLARERRADPQLAELVRSSQTFENFKLRQRKVRLLGLSTLGLLTLMLLFAATWSAIHLARGIGAPIRALAEAADEVARGNLAHRVATIADDELAILAASFNQMTAQLAENRRRIEAGAGELRDKNLALDERRNYIETVLESLSTGVVSLDEENRVTTINAAAVAMLRLGETPLPGAPLKEMLSVEDHLVLERVLARARRTGRAAWQMELARGASQDAGVVPVALTATALGNFTEGGAAAGGRSSRGIVLVIEDLTELLAAQRAAAWSEVARRMAHEIKNPLTPIQLSAERIARNFRRLYGAGESGVASTASNIGAAGANGGAVVGDGVEAERVEVSRVAQVVEECTTTITREVAGLKAMVDEFSRFARLPHARLEAADLNEVVRQAVALYEDRLEDVRMNVHLARTLPPGMLDAEQMRRAVVNLIDNALEAMSDSEGERRITVATGHDPSRGMLLIEIADTGHGIERSDFSRLFQPYFSTRGRGTGLGLAIVQRIVGEHGGRIRAEPNRPRGAKFLVEIPVTDEPRNEQPSAVSHQPSADQVARLQADG
ncbi:MAG TPA: ATP-binding protein [Pyrinomonadaceae bacterium]|jgi:nitrogen fixation/metabolism regulation signal transduction histidine kinase|nr:ATP-binding protein [Pyrinomonadaceae bacterium]